VPDAIVFDFDGTMVDTETPEYESVRLVYADFGLDLPPDQWIEAAGTMWGTDWVEQLRTATAGAANPHEARRRKRAYITELNAAALLRPGLHDLLDEIRAQGIPMGIASNSASDWIDYQLERLGITDYFDASVTIDRVERGKPFPDPYVKACALLGGDPHGSVAFEDSEAGTQSAASAGLFVVAAPGPMTVSHDLSTAHLRIDTFEGFTLADLARALEGARS
jgi:HAD superfamily hydrolase (TIGR01509 family)